MSRRDQSRELARGDDAAVKLSDSLLRSREAYAKQRERRADEKAEEDSILLEWAAERDARVSAMSRKLIECGATVDSGRKDFRSLVDALEALASAKAEREEAEAADSNGRVLCMLASAGATPPRLSNQGSRLPATMSNASGGETTDGSSRVLRMLEKARATSPKRARSKLRAAQRRPFVWRTVVRAGRKMLRRLRERQALEVAYLRDPNVDIPGLIAWELRRLRRPRARRNVDPALCIVLRRLLNRKGVTSESLFARMKPALARESARAADALSAAADGAVERRAVERTHDDVRIDATAFQRGLALCGVRVDGRYLGSESIAARFFAAVCDPSDRRCSWGDMSRNLWPERRPTGAWDRRPSAAEGERRARSGSRPEGADGRPEPSSRPAERARGDQAPGDQERAVDDARGATGALSDAPLEGEQSGFVLALQSNDLAAADTIVRAALRHEAAAQKAEEEAIRARQRPRGQRPRGRSSSVPAALTLTDEDIARAGAPDGASGLAPSSAAERAKRRIAFRRECARLEAEVAALRREALGSPGRGDAPNSRGHSATARAMPGEIERGVERDRGGERG
jgi:hypothetical protein